MSISSVLVYTTCGRPPVKERSTIIYALGPDLHFSVSPNQHTDTMCWSVQCVRLLWSHLVIPEQQGVKGIRQVEGQRRGGRDGARVDQPAGGWRHGLAELP